MKKNFTIYDFFFTKRLLGLLFLLLVCTNSFGQSFCRPVSQTNSVGGLLCVGLNVDSPANAYDNDAGLATYATLTNAVGLACFAQETLTLNQTAKAGDQIVMYLGTGNGLLDLSLFSNVSVQAKLSGTNVGASVSLNSPILNLNLLNGNSVAQVRFTVTGDTNQIQIQAGGLLSLLVNLRIYDVRLDFAKPTVSGGLAQTICSGTSIALSATPAVGTNIAWYDSATSTTPLITGDSFTTPNLTANTTYYIGVSRATSCEGNDRLPVVINVSNPIAPAINTTGTAICSTGATQSTTLSVINPISGTTYNWYAGPVGGPSLASGNSYTPTVPLGTTSFYVEASIGTCLSSRTQVNVVATAVPSVPTVLTQSVTIQSGQNAILNAMTSEPGVILNWYEAPTGGIAVATNMPTFTTPILTATKTYYVEAQSATGNCVSASRIPVTVTVITTSPGGCLGAGAQQTSTNGFCLLCTSTDPNNSVDGDPATFARLTLPVGLLGGYIQQTVQFNNPGKAGDIVDVELALPGGLADVALLGGVSLATYNGATYNNDRVLITNNSLVTLQLLSGNRFKASITAGANFDRVEIRFGAAVTVLTSLDIYQATYRYKVPAITGTKTICSGQNTTLTAALAVGESVQWFSAATGGTALASTAAFPTPTLAATTTYYVELTRNGCVNSERSAVTVLVNDPVAPALSASPVNLCAGGTSTITVTSPVVGTTYNWYDAATGGNLVTTGTSFTTPALTTNTSYFVEAVIGTCISPARTEIPLIVTPLPAAPTVVSSNVIIQSGQNVALQVSNPVVGVDYDWYDVATGGTALATNIETFTPSPALTANKTYYVEARNTVGGCKSSVRTAVNVVVINTVSNCLQPNSQLVELDPGLLCVLCNSADDANAVDGNINTASTLTIPVTVGLLGSYIQQTLTFPNPGEAGDIIDVELEVPGGLLDLSLLSYISLATYNGTTYNNDRVNITSNLLNVQLLSGNRFKASFTTAAAFNKIEIRLGGTVSLLRSLKIYGASYRYPNATITGNAAPICAGGTATLAATASGTETFTWYDSPTGGAVAAVNPTLPLANTTTFYLEATRGTCINSVRQPVTVTVLPYGTAADITIATPQEATCAGGIVLSPTAAFAGAQFKYYADQAKTIPIVDGGTGSVGQTYAIDPTTSALTVTGLTGAGAPYSYFVSVVSTANCENAAGDLKEVTVTYPVLTPLVVAAAPLVGCGSVNLKDAITPYDNTGNTTYTFYDPSNNAITADQAANITLSGTYSIQAQGNGVTCPSVKLPVTVTINALPTLNITTSSISINPGDSVLLNATSDGTIAWFDQQGNALTGPAFTTGVLNTPGVYTYTVVASNANCSRTGTVTVNVVDISTCQLLTERVYATTQTSNSIITGAVTNGAAAVDGNPQTFSTITTGVGLLGIGTTWQDLKWPANIVKGTPVTIKLGSEYSAVALGQNLSVIGTKNGVDIGALQSVSGSLLNLLSGDSAFEFTFVPANATGPQDYDGIRIQSASILSVAQNTKVFDAYYTKSVATVACTPGDIQDIYYGATDLGVGALTATVGVSDAWNVADNDITTYATMYSGVGALAAADLTVAFKTPSIVSDTLRIVISKPGTILGVNLLTGFSVQRYLGNVAVGTPIDNSSSLLNLRLLTGNAMAVVLVNSQPEPYDRVRIRLGGVVGVLDQLRVHTVERVANTEVIGADPNNKVTVCPGTDVTLRIPEEACSTYVWYDAPTGGNVVANGITYTVPATLAAGIYTYYVQPVRYGCEALARGEVTVEVRASSPVNALTDITLNGGTTTSICSPSGTVTLATSLSGTPLLTNPVYYWYSFNGTTSQLIPGAITNQLTVNGLTPGTYTYYVGVSSNEFCETAAADRKQITFIILPPSTATDITVDDAVICHDVDGVLTPTTSLTNPIFTWYLDNNKTLPIADGASINGVTYAINATTGALTATGLTKALSPISYFAAVSSDTSCENLAGDLQEAVIIVSDPGTPTTTDTTQDFCLLDAPTFASIQTDQTGVLWYASPTGGTPIVSTTALTSGVYYGGLVDAVTNCESSVRLAVTISVNDPGTPTTADTTQDFCLVNAPTVANIQIDTPAVGTIVWYTAATGGTAIPTTTALATGNYYAAIFDAATNCESAVRLAIAVTVNDPGTPTTADATQEFCLLAAPTVASIQVDAPAVGTIVWYTAATGGTAIPTTTALATGNYYAAIFDAATNCESAVRLAIAVTVNDPGTPTTADATQEFCLLAAPTVASLQIDTPAVGTIVWYTAATGGTAIPTTTALATGNYYAAIFDAATNCESAVRLAIAVTVNDPGTPTTADTTQDFCLVNAPTVANIQIDAPAVGAIVWYTAATGGTAIPTTTALATGNYYAAIFDAATNCESAVRLAIAVTVNDPGTPTTADATQEFCLLAAPTVASIQVDAPAVGTIVWYTAASGGTAISTTTALATGNYYAAIFDAATNCESAVRLAIAVTVNDPGTPTTADATQEFCLLAAPTVANIQIDTPVVGTIVWYTAATGGTAIPTTTALATGNYYAAIFDAATNCESAVRLAIAVTVNDPGTPTTADTTQDFCLVNAPTVANIQIDAPAVGTIVWYTAATGGTAIPSTTALATGNYYAAIFDAATNCESAVRLAIAVTVNDPGTPTTTDATQEFCLLAAPTVANIQIDTPAVGTIVWYTAATGGTAIPTTTALATGNYYAAIFDAATNCESAVRLAIAVTVNDPGTPTTADTTQEFCLLAAPTVANIQIDTPAVGTIVWYTATTGGTAIPTTTALATGNYYAAIFDAATNCESAVRLAIAVTVNDPGTPTTADTTQDFCLVNAPTVANIQIDAPAVGTIVWYTAATGGTAIPSTTALATGNYYAAIFDVATNCESAVRLAIAVTVNDPGTPTTADATQEFCLLAAPTVANIQIDTPAVGTIVWYTAATGGTAIPTTTALATGNYYAAIFDAATNCESAVRLAIAVTVNDPGTPTTADATQEFCLLAAPTVANIQIDTPAVGTIVWYTAATGGTAIPATTALATGNYYAAIFDAATNCESAVRLAIAVTVNDPGTPTTADTTQDFCLVNAPTVASIQIDAPAVGTIVWYTAATGGTAIPSTTALATGNYYAAIFDAATNCESAVRLAIAVTVNDPGTPTTADATQEFCLLAAPTVANIQIDAPAVGTIVWYTAATGGTAIPTTTALATGNYYAAIFDAATNCESAVRLAIAVTVNDPGTPTTADTTQDFCLVNAPTVANIQIDAPAVGTIVWYTAATGGTAIPTTTALATGNYYAAIFDVATNCESAVRLAIAVTVNDPGTPTTADATQEFCLLAAPTVANIQVDSPTVGTIVWYTAATGGTAIPTTTALATGNYYAAIFDAATNCESAVRLAIAVTVNDPGTPTTADATQEFCLLEAPTVANIQVDAPAVGTIVWYTAATGGTAIPTTTALATGNYYAAIFDAATNCESAVRLAIAVTINDPGTPTTADATQDFCLVNAPTVASIQIDAPAVGTIVWYTAATGGTAIPTTTALATGNYYAAIFDAATNCESTVRLAIAVTINDPGTPTTADTTQDFCLVNAPTVANIQTNETNVVWYASATGGTAIAPTTALASGIYYAALVDTVTGCESNVRLAVTISVTDPATPTTTDTTQDFCLVNAPTVANIQTNETNVVWYSTATGGTAIPATTALASGIYYAALLDAVTNCESSIRLAVTISVTDPGTPTTTDTTQDFCLVNAPTVANIQVNQTNVVWYAAATGGTAIAPTTALANGVYYAALLDAVTNCESNVRLAVTISVTDPGKPTTTDTTQDFCLVNAPTVANIQTNQTNVVWYSTATGGTAIPATTALANGIYYAALLDATTGCQSNVRLAVTISVTNPATPTTTAATQVFCSGTNPTVSNIQVNEANVVWYATVTGGTIIAPTTALATGVYYGAIKDPVTGCESSVRLMVTVTVGNTINPTTNNASQSFCSVNAPTIASIQVNQTNVVWYSTATGGTAIPATTALTTGVYYGNIIDPLTSCESTTRLQVNVTVVNPSATPTTNAATQNFCTLNAPIVGNIQVNEANVIWYTTATGGTALPSATVLATGTYYGAVSSAIGCENPVRLAVNVIVNTPGTVTTPRTTQTFCLSKIPTIANILVNEPNVVFYSAATGGTALAANTPLVAGTYYAGALSNTTNGCDSAARLAITIAFENDALVQLTSTDNTPCVFQGVTYSIANGKSNYVWSVTNGTITSGGGNADGSVTVSWSDIGPGTVKVTYVNTCDETTTKTLNVTVATCSDLTITNTVDNPTPNFGDHVTFTVTVNNVGEGSFINTIVSDLLPSGYDLISASTTLGTYDNGTQLWTIPTLNAGQSVTLTIVAEVLPSGNYLNVATVEISTPLDVDASNNSASASVEPICLTVYNEFTPNNDGANDLFRIDCIETHPNNELKVYNRYGALVYSKVHYENDWDGTANVSGVVNRGDMLPTGTYFYVITIGDGTVKKGWLSIMR
ncbi:gliding motility-associated-like protein [Flavobacterium sp. 270]|uniref:Ig-like domain-containing protein n=1 Tax=Flavobacterium sp. 270 TaxID=2512114 RepID=UPI00106592D9|nr:gliding motility-associated C-terminal domain-containing protein [Flavobacterium sp. 270]TDW52015.1 gliding motility-associated-like protein [Flavobacterium sp. 270]